MQGSRSIAAFFLDSLEGRGRLVLSNVYLFEDPRESGGYAAIPPSFARPNVLSPLLPGPPVGHF